MAALVAIVAIVVLIAVALLGFVWWQKREDLLNEAATAERGSPVSDASAAVQDRPTYRYWGVGSKDGLWSNTYYRFRWATFHDENGVILNDENFKHVTSVSNGVPTFTSKTSPNFNVYTAAGNDSVVSENNMPTIANWSLNQHPAMYVDLGSPKDVRKVIHVARNNHTMYDPIVVASHDGVNWTIVKELDQPDPNAYSSPDTSPYVSTEALWTRTLDVD